MARGYEETSRAAPQKSHPSLVTSRESPLCVCSRRADSTAASLAGHHIAMEMLRAGLPLLLVGAACAAAVAPLHEAHSPNDQSSTARLEALVRDMAEQQGAIPAPTPEGHSEDVVILEGSERRRLGRCTCNHYRNGARAGSPVCNKMEGGQRVCYPQNAGTCSDREATLCGSSGGGGRPQASPAPSFFNAEEQDADDVYLNVNLQIYDAHTNSSALPSADQFAHALAQLTSTRRSRVNVLVTRGAPQGVRAGTPVTAAQASAGASGTTATVQATFAVKTTARREALEASLLLSEELPEINGRSFRIVHQQVFEASGHPLVCAAHEESVKAEATALLRQLVALKRTEVELMQQGVVQNAGHAVCDDALLQRIAHQLGVSQL
jgi:hypothetical protein